MNAREFERSLLGLVFESNERLTPHFVAYRLNLPFAEAKSHLEDLAAKGILLMEVDDDGKIWYEVPPGVERPKVSAQTPPPVMPKVTPQPQMRVVMAPPRAGIGIVSIFAILAVGALILKFLFPILLILGVVGLIRYHRFRREQRAWFLQSPDIRNVIWHQRWR